MTDRPNKQLFHAACEYVISCERERAGIGTLSEKTLHAVLKRYFEPNEENHEIRLGSFVADIFRGDEIIEIQTANFNLLNKKLPAFLEKARVTVVYPLAKEKWLCWIDSQTGEVTKKRKCPKPQTPHDAFFELYKIKPLLKNPKLRICFVLLNIEEYRYLNGWSKDKKRGSSRCERIPTEIFEEIYVETTGDYINLLPQSLAAEFSAKDYAKASRLSISRAQTALNVLFDLGAVERIGKNGNAYIYSVEKK